MFTPIPRPCRVAHEVFDEDADQDRPQPGELRRWATGEPYHVARQELSAAGGVLIPTADRHQMEGEAQVLAALIAGYGVHRPRLTGGPFGIVTVTPRPDDCWSACHPGSCRAGQRPWPTPPARTTAPVM